MVALTAATNWDKWVAIGTLALAAVTFLAVLVGVGTALLTRRLADAAQTTAQADTRALENSVRPLLLPVPAGLTTQLEPVSFRNIGFATADQVAADAIHTVTIGARGGTWLISVPVRNAGVGPAVIWVPHPSIRIPPDSAATQGHATHRVVPVNERTRLNFAVNTDRLGANWYVNVAYTDVDGTQPRRTELAIRARDRRYEVVGFALYRGAEDDLIVASGEGWDIARGEREWQ